MLEILAVLLELGRSDPGVKAAVAYGLSHILHAWLAVLARSIWESTWLTRLACLSSHLPGLQLDTWQLATLRHETAAGRWRRASVLEGFPDGIREQVRGYVRRTRVRLTVPGHDLVGTSSVHEVTEVWSELPWYRRRGTVLIRHIRGAISSDWKTVQLSALYGQFNSIAALRPNGRRPWRIETMR
jgi:hypothetical protein